MKYDTVVTTMKITHLQAHYEHGSCRAGVLVYLPEGTKGFLEPYETVDQRGGHPYRLEGLIRINFYPFGIWYLHDYQFTRAGK